MANTYTIISSQTLTGSAASVTFSSIPQTYQDLCIISSHRTDATTDFSAIFISINNDLTGTSEGDTWLQGNGSAASSSRYSLTSGWDPSTSTNSANSTSNTFANTSIYFPNYAASSAHQASMDMAMENNATAGYIKVWAYSNTKTVAISNIKIQTQAGNFISGSSFYLYGIKNS